MSERASRRKPYRHSENPINTGRHRFKLDATQPFFPLQENGLDNDLHLAHAVDVSPRKRFSVPESVSRWINVTTANINSYYSANVGSDSAMNVHNTRGLLEKLGPGANDRLDPPPPPEIKGILRYLTIGWDDRLDVELHVYVFGRQHFAAARAVVIEHSCGCRSQIALLIRTKIIN